MPIAKLVHSLYQFLFDLSALELAFLSPVTKLVRLLCLASVLINTITVKSLRLKVRNMQTIGPQKDSAAWVIQTWAAFVISISMTTFGIVNLPVDSWVKGFMGMGLAFSIGSTFTLAKTTRDLHETRRLTARLDEAKVEKLLSQHDPLNLK